MSVRRATAEDAASLTEMACEFWKSTVFEEDSDPQHIAAMVKMCVEIGMAVIAEKEGVPVGFACGVFGPSLGNPEAIVGTEMAWYMYPEYRGSHMGVGLMKELERAALDNGVKYWNMVSMESASPEIANKIYEKLGYKRVETSFMRTL